MISLMCNGCVLDKGSIEKIDGYFADKCIPCDHENLPTDEEKTAVTA